MPFRVIREDITRVHADAIVNTANPKPIYSDGTDYAIYQAAGAEQLLAERRKIGNMKPGQAAVTPAFELPAKILIHTVEGRPIQGEGAFDCLLPEQPPAGLGRGMREYSISHDQHGLLWIPEGTGSSDCTELCQRIPVRA